MEAHQFRQKVQRVQGGARAASQEYSLFHWSMDSDYQITYKNDQHHTLSLYLGGGVNNIRVDSPGKKGEPGKFCIMPQQQESVWQINQKVEFAHLYFSHAQIQKFAAMNHDLDTRFVELAPLLFQEDAKLMALFKQCYIAKGQNQLYCRLRLEQNLNNILQHLLFHYNTTQVKRCKVTGGLSVKHRRKIQTEISGRLGEKLTIAGLAKEIGLSPYHFAHMFKQSFGLAPAQYINLVRVEAVKKLLATGLPLAQISSMAGFSQQSHMTNNFKLAVGATPAQYRSLMYKQTTRQF